MEASASGRLTSRRSSVKAASSRNVMMTTSIRREARRRTSGSIPCAVMKVSSDSFS